MSTEFKLPEIAEGVEEVEVDEIYVAEGDVLDGDTSLMVVNADKSSAPITCNLVGTISKLHVATGDTIPIGAVLVTVEESGAAGASQKETPEEKDTTKEQEPEKSEPAEETAQSEKKESEEKKESKEPSTQPQSDGQPGTVGTKSATAPKSSTAAQSELVKVSDSGEFQPPPPASPDTRRFARELGVDLRKISGSASGGRITTEDVQAFVRDLTTNNTVAASAGGIVSPPTLPEFSKYGQVTRERMSKLAKTAAQHLSMSWQVIPHVTQHDLVDITDLEAARKRLVKNMGDRGPKITMTAIMIKAVTIMLKANPKFNASLDPETHEIVYKNFYNVGVAVDTEFGLMVPVIRDSDQKSMTDIATDLTAIAGKARDRTLDISDMQGGTFTITNLGGIGGTAFTPIVNYPEVAILGMSRSQKQLALQDGKPVERLMLPLSLSYDHRVINGADAARFMVRLNGLLSDVVQLLVEC